MNKLLNSSILVCILFSISIVLFISSHIPSSRELYIYFLQKNIFSNFRVYANDDAVSEDVEKKKNSEEPQGNGDSNIKESGKEGENASFTNKDASDTPVDPIKDSDLEGFFKQDVSNFSYRDALVFKALSQRYKNILNIEAKLKDKELKLEILSNHFQDQIKSFNNIKQEVTSLMDDYKNFYDAEILALVKVYESMKPIEAAQVFSYMDISLLTKIAINMKEVKLSAIFAKMPPDRVNIVTHALLEAKKLSGTNINYVCNIVFGL